MRFSKVLVAIGLVVGALTVRSAAQTVPQPGSSQATSLSSSNQA